MERKKRGKKKKYVGTKRFRRERYGTLRVRGGTIYYRAYTMYAYLSIPGATDGREEHRKETRTKMTKLKIIITL